MTKLRHFVPLVGFVVPTAVIGYGVVIPRSCIAGVNDLTLGFAATIVGACVTRVSPQAREPRAHGPRALDDVALPR